MSKSIKPILEASYKPVKQAKKDYEKLGYKFDSSLSSPESKVFVSPSGKPSIAFRGSTTAKDFLLTDPALALGLGKYTSRFKEAQNLTKKVEQKYGMGADVYGHSLGGTLASYSGAKGNIVSYNKGVDLGDIGRTVPKQETEIRRSGDVVSALTALERKSDPIVLPSVGGILDTHSVKYAPQYV